MSKIYNEVCTPQSALLIFIPISRFFEFISFIINLHTSERIIREKPVGHIGIFIFMYISINKYNKSHHDHNVELYKMHKKRRPKKLSLV